MTFRITKDMDGAQKIRVCNALVYTHLIPVLEKYHGRELNPDERTTVYKHVSMLFMEPCPLDILKEWDNKFAEEMLKAVRSRN